MNSKVSQNFIGVALRTLPAFLSLAFLFPATSSAQPTPPSDATTTPVAVTKKRSIRFGVRGGLNVADLASGYDLPGGVATRFGFSVGGFATIDFGRHVAFEPGLAYAQRGGIDVKDRDASMTIAFDYLEVPLLVVGRIHISEQLVVRAFGGPSVALNLSARLVADGNSESVSDSVRGYDIGVVGGLGLEGDTAGLRLIFDTRYELGALNLLDVTNVPGESLHSRVLSFNGGVSF